MSSGNGGAALADGAHLVGSVPLGSAEEVFRTVSAALGPYLRRLSDGETGPRSDWIVWQYPVLSSHPQFEVCPPGPAPYRAMPRLRVREDADPEGIRLDSLGYAQAALSSYRVFATLKRDGVIPRHCRFQVSLPTPLAPVSAFVAAGDQSELEAVYETAMLRELATITGAVPADQLAVQWDANFEFAMLAGSIGAWFQPVREGVVDRLLRLARQVPREIELGFHLCYSVAAGQHFGGDHLAPMVDVANAVAAGADRPVNWLHIPLPEDDTLVAPLGRLVLRPETELYLGLLHLADGAEGARRRMAAATEVVEHFGLATECGWGRTASARIPELLALHGELAAPVAPAAQARPRFTWPEGFDRVLEEDWTSQPLEGSGLAYDSVSAHGWYSNLDPTVDDLARALKDGDILLDYSGGTGILFDRLELRIFDAPVGVLIVDSSAKFLRVALEKFRDDSRVALRLLRFNREERRLQRLDEVLSPSMLARGVDAVASTNAIHLYPNLEETVASWVGVLRPGGHLFVNSGNIRNPRARVSEWILDETVWVINDMAQGLVRTDPSFAAYRTAVDDEERMRAHAAFRDRVFLEPRPLDYYVTTLERAGLTVETVREQTIQAGVDDWYEFLTAYHDAVLGWVGGTEKIDGRPPTAEAVADRLRLMRQAMEILFGGRPSFAACWTYITARL